MSSGFFVNLALTEPEPITISSGLCKRMRYRQSTCQLCTDICPEQAIQLTPELFIKQNCIRCGLCINICPTEVYNSSTFSERYILDRIASLHCEQKSDLDSYSPSCSLSVHCSQAKAKRSQSLVVHCLGNLTENIFLSVVFRGYDKLELVAGDCASCKLAAGKRLLQDTVKKFTALQQQIGLDRFSLLIAPSAPEPVAAQPLKRRAFFKKIYHTVKEKSDASPVTDPLAPVTNKDEKSHPQRRKILAHILAENKVSDAISSTLLWRKMKVDQRHCTACGVCVAVCPTGALIKFFEGSQLVRTFDNALCTNCMLCKEACPEQVIDFEQQYDAANPVEQQATEVARIELDNCKICGERILAKGTPICPTCEKRQVLPLFANF